MRLTPRSIKYHKPACPCVVCQGQRRKEKRDKEFGREVTKKELDRMRREKKREMARERGEGTVGVREGKKRRKKRGRAAAATAAMVDGGEEEEEEEEEELSEEERRRLEEEARRKAAEEFAAEQRAMAQVSAFVRTMDERCPVGIVY